MNWRDHPHAPAPGTPVCRVDEVPLDNGLERVLGDAQSPFVMVLFRHGTEVLAYLNRCPHASISLNFSDDVFCVIDNDGERDVLCPHHSALFRLPSGVCHDGPCVGDRLSAVPLVVRGDQVAIGDEDPAIGSPAG